MTNIEEISSIRQAFFKIAEGRDKSLHTMPATAGAQEVQSTAICAA